MVNPRGLSVTLTNANTSYSLLTLLQTADAGFTDLPNEGSARCQIVTLQADLNAGGARFYIGNSGLTGAIMGSELVAGQAISIGFYSGLNPILLSSIYVRSDTAGVRMNVWVVIL